MGQKERFGELVHKGIVSRQLQVGHLAGDVHHILAHAGAHESRIGAQGRGVAQILEAFPGHVRQQPDLDGLLHVDVLAEGATEQAAGLEETSSSLEEMASMTRQNSENAQQCNNLMGEAKKQVDQISVSTEEMTGAIEAITCILSIKQDIIHPTINYETPDPDCDLDYVPNTARKAVVRVAMSNSFGLGGQNACLVLGKFEKFFLPQVSPMSHILSSWMSRPTTLICLPSNAWNRPCSIVPAGCSLVAMTGAF